MNSPNFRAMHSADWRPEAPGAKVATLVPNKLCNALALQMPGRHVGCTVMLSLLLASCAYRQDATGPSPGMQDGETTIPGSTHDIATRVPTAEQPPAQAEAFLAPAATKKRHVDMSLSRASVPASTPKASALPEAWTGAMADMPAWTPPDVRVAADMPEVDASSPVPAPAAALLDIDRESVRHWVRLSPWYALPVVLALGMPLIGIMGRRAHRRAPADRQEPKVSFDNVPDPVIGLASMDEGVASIPMGVGTMARVPWTPAPDPLSREDWSLGLVVRYAPLEESRPVFTTRTRYVVRIDDGARVAGSRDRDTTASQARSARADDDAGTTRAAPATPPETPARAEQNAVFAGPAPCQPIISEEPLPVSDHAEAPDASPAADETPAEPEVPPSLPVLLETILAQALSEGQVFVDMRDGLPVMVIADEGALSADVLAKLESALLETRDPEGTQATWLLTQVLALRMAHVDKREVDALHQAATTLALHGSDRCGEETRACWRARLIELDLARAARQSGASRLLALRNMAARHADAIEAGDGPVLRAWIETLLHWAQHQLGDSALAKFNDAAALAERLRGTPGMADEGQLVLGDVLLRRAQVEHGGVRARTLAEAQHLFDELFARAPSGRAALAVAEAALERGKHAQRHAAGEAFSHALAHAFLAGSDPRWQAASLRVRLAIQLAYESLPGMPVQGNVALELAQKLDRLPAPPVDAIEGMVQAFVRHEAYDRACRLCAEAWHAGARTPTLLETWRLASVQWAGNLTSPRSRSDWQNNERQRRVANQMQ